MYRGIFCRLTTWNFLTLLRSYFKLKGTERVGLWVYCSYLDRKSFFIFWYITSIFVSDCVHFSSCCFRNSIEIANFTEFSENSFNEKCYSISKSMIPGNSLCLWGENEFRNMPGSSQIGFENNLINTNNILMNSELLCPWWNAFLSFRC